MIKKTTGTWDMEKDKYMYFLAGDRNQCLNLERENVIYPYILIAVNEITDQTMEMIKRFIDLGVNWFIDSGIFWLTNEHKRRHGISMDEALGLAPEEIDGFDELMDRYLRVYDTLGDSVWGYIELDQGGMENKIRTRERLESYGITPMPVYHPFNDGWDYFDHLAENYDRICFGNVVQAMGDTRKKLVATAHERKRKYPDLWIHLLGMTPNEWLHSYPIDSGDSSTWLRVVRWNGYKERCMLRSFSDLAKNYQYKLGEGNDPDRRYSKSIAMSALGEWAHVGQWRRHIQILKDQDLYTES